MRSPKQVPPSPHRTHRPSVARGRIRRIAATLVTGALAFASAAACGEATPAEPESGHTVTIDHTMGSTTIDGIPERIVALGTQWLDATQVLGVTPVGYIDNVALTTGGSPGPWEPAELANATAIDARGDIVEQVAALNPDLVLAPGFATDQQSYDRLSRLAPTLPSISTSQIESWESQVEIMGRILDKEDQARSVTDDVHARIGEVAARNPGLAGKTFATTYLHGPTQLMVLADPDDGAADLFADLGLALPQNLVDQAGAGGRIPLSPERVNELNVDLLVMTGQEGFQSSATSLPGWDDLPAVRKNGVAFLDLATGTGLNVPSPLSIPYVLDALEPALAGAAQG